MDPSSQKEEHITTPEVAEPDQIGEVTRVFGNCKDEHRTFTEEYPTAKRPIEKARVVGEVFDNADFAFHDPTVEPPLRMNLQISPERVARLETEIAFFLGEITRSSEVTP